MRFTSLLLFTYGAAAARNCGQGVNSSSISYSTRIAELRWDSADPSNGNNFATVAISLTDSRQPLYPLYECNAEWPETWGGWHEGDHDIIWSDCIWTGAASGKDDTVSFALDWRNKTMYVAHTFACSDRPGSNGLATGTINLDLDCKSTEDGTSYCVLKRTSTGSRPALDVITTLVRYPSTNTTNCSSNYQSWRLENWLRQYQMSPASLPSGSTTTPLADTGPSFNLINMADSTQLNCTTTGKTGTLLEGACTSDRSAFSPSTTFTFSPELNMLAIRQKSTSQGCGTVVSDVVGVDYMQAACDQNFNSNVYTCTSLPVWVGTGIF